MTDIPHRRRSPLEHERDACSIVGPHAMNDKAISVFRLLDRSPKDADGWAETSAVIMGAVIPLIPAELIETETDETGAGRVRLSERGKIVNDYI